MTSHRALAALGAVLMVVAAGAGSLVPELYRDNALVRASWLGNDLVTLFLAAPVLIGAAVLSSDSPRAVLVMLGTLAYALYSYAFYLFGAAYNVLFLVYVGIVVCATLGLVAGLASPALRNILDAHESRRTRRVAGGAVLLVSVTLGLFWVSVSVGASVSGTVPDMVAATAHPTNVTGALDLWLVVTFGVLGGAWLVQGRPWGFVISAIWSVKGTLYMAALSAASVTAFAAEATSDLSQLVLWIPVGVVCGAVAAALLAAASRRSARR